MLRRGTRSRSADQIAEAIDTVGGSLDTSAGSEHSTVQCAALSKDAGLCLDLVADVLLRPTFPEDEMGEVRDQFTGAINQRYDDPGTLAQAHFDNLLFGDAHPQGWAVMPEDVRRIRREDLHRFWRAYYRPNNSLMVVAGDVDLRRLRAEIERRLGSWERAEPPSRPTFTIPPRQGTRYLLVDKADLTQATLMFGHPGLSHRDPHWYDATVMNYVLGGSDFSSRLMIEVRARRGLTYGIVSSFGASLYPEAFTVSAATKNESAWDALRASVAELRKMTAEGPTAEEVAKAHGYYAGSYPFKQQSSRAVAGSILAAELHGLGIAYVEELPVRLGQVDAGRARAAAARYLHPDDLTVVIVGSGAAVAPQLERAGVKFERIGYRDPISAAERTRSRR
jgi:zinc protease